MTLHLKINPVACAGHGLCAELLPELIELDDWGYPIVHNKGVVPPHFEELAQKAAEVCPTVALLLERKRRHHA
jgi:ferredoxin